MAVAPLPPHLQHLVDHVEQTRGVREIIVHQVHQAVCAGDVLKGTSV